MSEQYSTVLLSQCSHVPGVLSLCWVLSLRPFTSVTTSCYCRHYVLLLPSLFHVTAVTVLGLGVCACPWVAVTVPIFSLVEGITAVHFVQTLSLCWGLCLFVGCCDCASFQSRRGRGRPGDKGRGRKIRSREQRADRGPEGGQCFLSIEGVVPLLHSGRKERQDSTAESSSALFFPCTWWCRVKNQAACAPASVRIGA